jgi:hypothetical protein
MKQTWKDRLRDYLYRKWWVARWGSRRENFWFWLWERV